eukprot:gene22991-biopygen23784
MPYTSWVIQRGAEARDARFILGRDAREARRISGHGARGAGSLNLHHKNETNWDHFSLETVSTRVRVATDLAAEDQDAEDQNPGSPHASSRETSGVNSQLPAPSSQFPSSRLNAQRHGTGSSQRTEQWRRTGGGGGDSTRAARSKSVHCGIRAHPGGGRAVEVNRRKTVTVEALTSHWGQPDPL